MASQTKSAGTATRGNVAQPAPQPGPHQAGHAAASPSRITQALHTMVQVQTMLNAISALAGGMLDGDLDSEKFAACEAICAFIEKAERGLPEAQDTLQQLERDGGAPPEAMGAPGPAPEAPSRVTDGELLEAAVSGSHAYASRLAWQQWSLAVSVREAIDAKGYAESNRRGWLAGMASATSRELALAIDLLPRAPHDKSHAAASTLAWQADALSATVRDMMADLKESDPERLHTRGWLAAMAAEKAHELARVVDALPVQTTSGSDAETVLEAAHG
jgi:hypothetical protein